MKKRILSLLCAVALVAGLMAPAMAAETDVISVQLDGETLTFTDAVPTAKDGRTYLPARVVLEALGATVSADATAGTVTAVRDGKTLTMTIGSTEATIAENGLTLPLTMDAAPYVEGNRTYVPLRFAAQAFGCAVGWDSAKKTAVLVDSEKLVEKTLANHSFTLLEKMFAYAETYTTGTWATQGSVSMNMGGLGAEKLMAVTGAVKGITSGQSQAQMNMDMNMDMTGFADLITAMGGQAPTAEDLAALKMALSMEIRADLSQGMYYVRMEGTPAQLTMPENTWLSMDMNTLMAQSGLGMDLETLMAAQTADPAALIAATLSQLEVNDSANSYASAALAVESIAALLDDSAFTKTATGYENKLNYAMGGDAFSLTITLDTNAKEEVTGYGMDVDYALNLKTLAARPGNESLKESLDALAAQGISLDRITITLNAAVDAQGTSTAKITAAMGELFSLDMDVEATMTATTEQPVTAPPAGATVVDYFEFLATMLPQN